MKLIEIKKLAPGAYVYNTKELIEFINSEYRGLGSELFNNGYLDMKGNQDSVIYNIEQAIEDNIDSKVPFTITNIVETQSGRLWHVIDV